MKSPVSRRPAFGVPPLRVGRSKSPQRTNAAQARVIIVGGDDRTLALEQVHPGLRAFPSAQLAGEGSKRRALLAITNGKPDLVIVLCRWLGHSDYHAIAERCRKAGVRLQRVLGGFTAARQAIQAARAGK
ncbi:MAG TPA: hypothetical protein PKA64_00935 [Myxococcota bacterium]|nr:hypothetical protein [Myxococcota bacterium]